MLLTEWDNLSLMLADTVIWMTVGCLRQCLFGSVSGCVVGCVYGSGERGGV